MDPAKVVTCEQIEALMTFLESHQELVTGQNMRTKEGRVVLNHRWKECASILNSVAADCPKREPRAWRCYFHEYKSKLVRKIRLYKESQVKRGDSPSNILFTPLQQRLYNMISQELGCPLQSLPINSRKRSRHSSKSSMKCLKYCIDLVKVHGRPIEMFDDEAFQKILLMVPISAEERDMIKSRNIKRIIEKKSGDDDDDDESNDEFEEEYSRAPLFDCVLKPSSIKNELQCNCPARGAPDDLATHAADCPKFTHPAYWNFFTVSVDEATCSMCGQVISWSAFSTLKEHLVAKHPGTKFVDDDEQFDRGPSSIGSCNDQLEEVYLPDDYRPVEPSKRKRKRPKSQPPPAPSRSTRKTLARSSPKLKNLLLKANRIDPSEDESSRSRAIECFGVYVASMMKLLPREKCVTVHTQIVECLAAAA